AGVAEPGKEHRHRVGRVAQLGSRTKPDHVDTPVSPDRHLWPSHGTDGHHAAGIAVHANRLREIPSIWLTPHVLDISRGGIALEINHVQHALAVEHCLRLNPFAWRAQQPDGWHLR